MDKLSLKAGLIGLALGLTVSTHSVAKIVFDPSNFAKNSVTAAQQVKQTAHQAAILSEEIRQYQMMVQDLKQLSPSIVAQGITRGYVPAGAYSSPSALASAAAGVYNTLTAVQNNMTGYEGTYAGLDDLMKEVDRTSIAARVTPDKVLQYDFMRAQKGIQQDKNYYNSLKDLTGQLTEYKKRSDTLASSLPSQNGTVQLLQTIGAQNTVLQDQLSHLIQVTTIAANKSLESSLRVEDKNKEDARTRDQIREREKKASNYFNNKSPAK